MKKLKLSIESFCDIRRLEATLDFSRGGNAAVYASNDRPRAVHNAIISRMAAGAERPDDAAAWFCIPRVAHDIVGADGAQAAGAGMRPAGCSRTPPPRRGPRP